MLGRTVRSFSTPLRFAAAAAVGVFFCLGLILGDADTLAPVWEYELPGICSDLTFSPNERFVAFAGTEGIGLLDLSSGKEVWTKKLTEVSKSCRDSGFHTATVTSSGTTVFAGSGDYRYVWAFDPKGKPLWWQKVRGTPGVARLFPDETRVAVATCQGRLYVFTVNGKRLWTSKIPNVTVPMTLDVTKDGSRICVAGMWGGVAVFRGSGGCLWARGLGEGDTQVYSDGYERHYAAMSGDGQTVAVSSRIRMSSCVRLAVFDGLGRRLWTRYCLDGWSPSTTPALRPDGERIAACFQDFDWSALEDRGPIHDAEHAPNSLFVLTRGGKVL